MPFGALMRGIFPTLENVRTRYSLLPDPYYRVQADLHQTQNLLAEGVSSAVEALKISNLQMEQTIERLNSLVMVCKVV